MKKTYINPTMLVSEMTTHQMLCDSLTVNFGDEVSSTEGACGRDFDFDDEE